MKVTHLAECGSTNDEAWEHAQIAPDEVHLVYADVQSKGRGRQGRAWVSAPLGNLYASLFVPHPRVQQLTWLPLAAGVSMCEAITMLTGPLRDLRLKWPNDIYWEDAKLGGILCESKFQGDQCIGVVVGLGLNIAEAPAVSDRATIALKQIMTSADPSLNDQLTKEYCLQLRNGLAQAWAERMLFWVNELNECTKEGTRPEALKTQWLIYGQLQRFNRIKTHDQFGQTFEAEPVGLDAQGRLLIRTAGTIKAIDQAE